MPLGYCHVPSYSKVQVEDTSHCTVPVSQVTQVVERNGKKYKKVSTVYEERVPSGNRSMSEVSSSEHRPYRVEHQFFEVNQ